MFVYRHSNIFVGTTGYYLRPGCWYYIECKWVCKNAPDGEIHVRINGEDVASFTGIDTLLPTGGYTGWDNVGWYNCWNTADALLDDIYVCDQNGSVNNNYLGDVIVRTRSPNGDASVGFTRSSGATNYTLVNDSPLDADFEDTNYVESGTATTKDLYDYTNLETEDASASIIGCQIQSVVRATDAQRVDCKHKIKSGVTEIGKTTQNFLWDVYTFIWDIQETDPNTGSLWTPTNFDAAQFGIEVA